MAKVKNVPPQKNIPHKKQERYNERCDESSEHGDSESEFSDTDLRGDINNSGEDSTARESDTSIQSDDLIKNEENNLCDLIENEESNLCSNNKEELNEEHSQIFKTQLDELITKTLGSSSYVHSLGSNENIDISTENEIIQKKTAVTLLDLNIKNNRLIAHRPNECGRGQSSSTQDTHTQTKKGDITGEKTVKSSKEVKISSSCSSSSRKRAVNDISTDCKLAATGDSGHVEITVPNDLQILSVIVKSGTGMKNGLVIPLGSSHHKKLCDCSLEPKRIKTRKKWTAVQSTYFFFTIKAQIS